MRGDPRKVSMLSPDRIRDAVAILATDPAHWTVMAGGTDLMVQFEAGKLKATQLLNISNINELHEIRVSEADLAIGALATYSAIRQHPAIIEHFPNLVAAAKQTGGIAIQNRGTIGGNIANGSPAADSPPALLSYGAAIELVSQSGTRQIPYEHFHNGYKSMELRPGEIIARVRLPLKHGLTHHFYQKVGTRNAQAISKVVFAGTATVAGGIIKTLHLALGSVGPTAILAKQTATLVMDKRLTPEMIEQAKLTLESEISPIDDIRSIRTYRMTVAKNILEHFLLTLR